MISGKGPVMSGSMSGCGIWVVRTRKVFGPLRRDG